MKLWFSGLWQIRWCGHVLRREDSHVLKMAFYFGVEGQRKKWRLKRKWRKQVDKKIYTKVCVNMEVALYQSKWIVGVNLIATG